MAYQPRLDWVDDPDAGPTKGGMTPIRAADLKRIEQGVADAHNIAESVEKGDPGKDGARGSRLWTTTGITGTSTDGTVFADSGISGALIYDYALNRNTGNLYVCSKGGNADVAEWKYDANLKGPKGDPGDDGDPGKDGFPTEEQWNTLVARVAVLEGSGGEAE